MVQITLITRMTEQEAFEKCWAHSPQQAASCQFTRCRHCTVARCLHIDVHDANDDNDNAWQGTAMAHGMGPNMAKTELRKAVCNYDKGIAEKSRKGP